MKPEDDAYGQMLLSEYVDGDAAEIVEREDGFIAASKIAPALYLATAAGLAFVGALLLPGTTRHRLTKEFESARFRQT